MAQVVVIMVTFLLFHDVFTDVPNRIKSFTRTFKNEIRNHGLDYVFDFRPLTTEETAQAFHDCIESDRRIFGLPSGNDSDVTQEIVLKTAPFLTPKKWQTVYGNSVGLILDENGLLNNSLATEYVERLSREVNENNGGHSPIDRVCDVVYTFAGFLNYYDLFAVNNVSLLFGQELYEVSGVPGP